LAYLILVAFKAVYYVKGCVHKSKHTILSNTHRKTDTLRSTVRSEQYENTKKGLSTYIFVTNF